LPQDKQQAAWYDGTTVYEEDHDPALYARGYSAGRGRGVKLWVAHHQAIHPTIHQHTEPIASFATLPCDGADWSLEFEFELGID
jgi:hypothetical protein